MALSTFTEHNMIEKIVNAATGEETIKEYSKEQILDSKNTQALAEKEFAELEAKRIAKKAVFEKLGLSEAEAKILLG